ncbi:hypothetical protein LX36DRAFT_634275 [Colletotrichum falcatum]|nr:hypothetical protein LX36DRAFT_634275 [Colletotrichum falcatum]
MRMNATAAAHGSTAPRNKRPKSDSLQKMLDLEHARKLERLKGRESMPVYTHPSHLAFQQVLRQHVNSGRPPESPPRLSPFPINNAPTPVKPLVPLQSRRRESSVQLPPKTDVLPSAMKASRRVTALPSLSISVPPPPSSTKTQIDRQEDRKESVQHKHKTVTFLDVVDPEEPADDDASSICHSPSWESFGQNKKKEKKNEAKMRKKDKGQAEKQAEKEPKSVKKMLAARLSKAPPSRPPNASRSISSPVTPADDQLRSASAQAFHDPPPPIRLQHTRQRSDSVAMQIKAALTGNKLPTQSQLHDDRGFIGGLKLEQKLQAADTSMPLRKPAPFASLTHQRANSFGPEVRVTPSEFKVPRSSSYGPQAEANRHREDEDDSTSKSARVASMHIPSWGKPLSSPSALPVPDASNLQQWKPQAAQSKLQDPTIDDDDAELEPPSALGEFVLEQERGRRRESYVHQSRQQSRERSVTGFKDEVRVSSARSHYPPQANRQHQHRTQPSSSGSSPLAGSFTSRDGSITNLNIRSDQSPQTEDFTITFRLPYTPPVQASPSQGSFDRSSSQGPPVDGTMTREMANPHERSLSRESLQPSKGPSVKSFRDAAKAAFQKVSSPGSSKASASSYFARAVRDNTTVIPSPSSSRYSADEASLSQAAPARPFVEPAGSTMTSRESSARPTDRSSMSSCDEGMPSSSPATTPDSSRPQSEKGLPQVDGELGRVCNEAMLVSDDTRSYRISQAAILTCSPTASNPRISLPPQIPVQTHEAHLKELEALVTETFSRNATVADADDSDSSQGYPTPTHTESAKSSTLATPVTSAPLTSPQEYQQEERGQAEDVALPMQNEPEVLVQRHPSLTKSRSSPELVLDTSFLPKLKHQPLTPRALAPNPPPRSAKRASVLAMSGGNTTAQAPLLPDATWRKSIVPLKTPANPSSYLEEARKSMQGPPPPAGPPRSNRASRASILPPNGTPEPVAKMLVECCGCKFLHDMPSKVYECMANPDGKVEDRKLGVSGVITTTVKCPWCSHGMTTRCCAGYAAVIYLKEKLH